MDKAIEVFAEHMQLKLDANKDKECETMNPDSKGRRWENCDLYWLLYRLRQETLELEEALYDHERESILDEAADVGNFAMMIHDNVSRTIKALKEEE